MTTVSVRMDENLKRDFDEICNELGLSMTTAITMLAKKMTREKRIPFEVSMDPFYSASNMAALNDSIEEMRQGERWKSLRLWNMSKITFTERAFAEYLYWQSQDKKTLKRINALLKDISRSPYEGIGKPEGLKENLSGYWSRRIDDVNRLVYRIENDLIEVYQCKGHYDD